jgi:hypothetical protein
MKYKFLAACCLLLAIAGCKKNGEEITDYGQGTGNCRLSGFKSGGYYGDTTSATINYNSDGSLASVISGKRKTVFRYNGDVIIAASSDAGGKPLSQDSVVLNDKRQIIFWSNKYFSSGGYAGTVFTYDAQGQLIRSHVTTNTYTPDHYYTWSDGDMIVDSVYMSALTGPIVVYYEYDKTRLSQYASPNGATAYFTLGTVWHKSRHLLKSQFYKRDSSTVTYTYGFDAAGKIMTDTFWNTGFQAEAYNSFSYDCK